MAEMRHIGQWLFYFLPDFVAYVLAAAGLAVTFVPEAAKTLDSQPQLRKVVAILLTAIGIGALFSSRMQRPAEPPSAVEIADTVVRKLPSSPSQPSPPQRSTSPDIDKMADEIIKEMQKRGLFPKQLPPSEPVAPSSAAPVAASPAVSRVPEAPDLQALQREAFGLVRQISDWIASNSQNLPNMALVQSPRDDAATLAEKTKAREDVERLDSEWAAKFAASANSLVAKLHITAVFLACTASGPYFNDDPSRLLGNRSICAKRIEEAAKNLK